MSDTAAPAPVLTVMTVNIHKGFSFFNRKFILPELRDAVRKVGADVVFLQEVRLFHTREARRFDREVDGILLLDKPTGISSNAALQQARRLFRALKAGHAGRSMKSVT